MLRGEKVKLRAVRRGDLPRLLDFYNDVEVELAGGGDPPRPTTLERLQRDFDREAAEPPRDKTEFGIEADGNLIGQDRKSTRLNSSHANISYAVFCLKK